MRSIQSRYRSTADSSSNSILTVAMLCIGLFMYLACWVPASSAAPKGKPGMTTLIVKMAKGMSRAQSEAVLSSHGGGSPKASIPKLALHIIEVPENAAEAIMKNLKDDPSVERVEADHTRRWQGTPSDTLIANQWSLTKIAWDQVYGTVTPQFLTQVAILDTGVDATHPDLIGNIGPGISVIDDSNGLTDGNGHGTWLAGIVAGRTDNAAGIAGVAFDHVRIMPVKVLDADGLGQDSDIIAGVIWAADNGASVI